MKISANLSLPDSDVFGINFYFSMFSESMTSNVEKISLQLLRFT